MLWLFPPFFSHFQRAHYFAKFTKKTTKKIHLLTKSNKEIHLLSSLFLRNQNVLCHETKYSDFCAQRLWHIIGIKIAKSKNSIEILSSHLKKRHNTINWCQWRKNQQTNAKASKKRQRIQSNFYHLSKTSIEKIKPKLEASTNKSEKKTRKRKNNETEIYIDLNTTEI